MRTVLSRNNKGFTLVELIVIIIIIGITSAVATVSFSGILNKQRLDTDYAVAESLSNEIEGIVLDEKVMNAYENKRNSIITLFWTEEQMYDGNMYVSAQEGGTALVPTDVFDFVDTSIYSAMNKLFNNENLPKSQSGRGFTLVINLSNKDPKGYVVVGDSMDLARNTDTNSEEENDVDYNVPSIINPDDISSDDDNDVVGCLPSNYDARNRNYTGEFANKFKNATKIVFTDAQPRRGVNFADCSAQHDMSIVYWNEGTTYYISTRKTGVKVKANTNSRDMFNELDKLEEIDLSMLDTSETTNMQDMFRYTLNLKIANVDALDVSSATTLAGIFSMSGYPGVLDLTSWSTSSRLTDLSWAFYGMPNVTEIKFSPNFNTSNVTNMSYAFSTVKNGAKMHMRNEEKVTHDVTSKLKKLDLHMFNTGSVTDMSHIFSELDSLEELNVANWDVRKVSNFKEAFYRCKIDVLDLSGWETAEAVDMYGMFLECTNLDTLCIPKFTITNVTGRMISGKFEEGFERVFESCSSLKELDLSNLGIPYGGGEPVELQIKSLGSTFKDCKKLVHIDFTNFKPVNVESLSCTFYSTNYLDKETYTFIENWELKNIKNLSYTFDAHKYWRTNIETLDLSKWSGYVTDMTNFFQNGYMSECPLTEIDFGDKIKFDKCISFKNAFRYCVNMKKYDFSKNGNTSNCEHFTNMFYANDKLEEIVGHKQFFNFSSVSDMTSMFSGCSSLKELQLGGCPVNNNSLSDIYEPGKGGILIRLGAIAGAFANCSSLKDETFSIPDFNTSNVISFDNLFSGCSSLKKIDTSWIEWNTVETTVSMFDGCEALVDLNIKGISSAEKLTDISKMFRQCYNLEQLDLSGLKTGEVTDMSYLFACCKSLKELNLRSFNTEKVTDMTAMFGGCYSVDYDCDKDVKEMRLEHIYVSDKFITRNVKNSKRMFYGCNHLPHFNSDIVDLTKAINSSLGGYLN